MSHWTRGEMSHWTRGEMSHWTRGAMSHWTRGAPQHSQNILQVSCTLQHFASPTDCSSAPFSPCYCCCTRTVQTAVVRTPQRCVRGDVTAVSIALWLPTFRENVVPLSSRSSSLKINSTRLVDPLLDCMVLRNEGAMPDTLTQRHGVTSQKNQTLGYVHVSNYKLQDL